MIKIAICRLVIATGTMRFEVRYDHGCQEGGRSLSVMDLGGIPHSNPGHYVWEP